MTVSVFGKNFKLIEISFLLRIAKLGQVIKKVEDHLQLEGMKESVFKLCKLFFIILYVAHMCGCANNIFAEFLTGYHDYNTWIYANGLQGANWFDRYVNAIYYEILTMVTAGSLITNSTIEKIFNILICMTLSVTFAYTINTIGIILNDMEKDSTQLKEKLNHINHYMSLRNLNQ